MVRTLRLAVLALVLVASVFAANPWSLVGNNQAPGRPFARRAVYCANRDSMVMFGGLDVVGQINQAVLVFSANLFEYKFSSNSWSTVTASGSAPSARSWFMFAVAEGGAPGECAVVLHGGYTNVDGGNGFSLNDTFLLQLNGTQAQWSQLVTTGGPGGRYAGDAVSRRGQIIHFGGVRRLASDGSSTLSQAYNDFMTLSLGPVDVNGDRGPSVWTEFLPANSSSSVWPDARYMHSMSISLGATPQDDQLVLFAGRKLDGQVSKMLSDLYIFSFGSKTWRLASGLRVERSSHVSTVLAGRYYTFGGVRSLPSSPNQDFLFNTVLITNISPALTGQMGLATVDQPQCMDNDGKYGLWCTAEVDGSGVPGLRSEMASVRRGDQLFVYGGRSSVLNNPFQDLWALNLTLASQNLVLTEADSLGTSDLASTMYFMIAILSMMVICFMVFVISLRRQRSSSPMFQAMMVARPRVVGARTSVVEALPLKTYRKKDADARRASRRQSRRQSQMASANSMSTPSSEDASDKGETGERASGSAAAANPAADDRIDEDDLHDLCAICLTDYEDGEQLRVLPCDHYFHPPCVDQWLRTHNACPMCKQAVDPDPERLENTAASQVVVSPQSAENPAFEPGGEEGDESNNREGRSDATSLPRDGMSNNATVRVENSEQTDDIEARPSNGRRVSFLRETHSAAVPQDEAQQVVIDLSESPNHHRDNANV